MNREKALVWLLRGLTYLVVFAIAYLVLHIIWHGLPALSIEFLFGAPRRGGAEGGIFPAMIGTMLLVLGTILLAFPLGMATAVYLAEFARENRFTKTVRLAIVTLAGIPSIVFGLFGLGLFVIFMGFGASVLAGCLTLACMVLPTIVVAAEEALRAVPESLRQGSLALGATKWQTVWKNVLPYAVPGMLTGSILAIGRAAGETAPILLTAAAFYLPRLPRSVYDQVMALPYHLYVLATQHPEAQKVLPLQYGTALVLLLLVLGVNLAAILLRIRFRKKHQW